MRDHLQADPEFQRRSARFLENHDEPRAAATFAPAAHEAAAVVTFLAPGCASSTRASSRAAASRSPMHLRRRPDEPADPELARFYDRLLDVLRDPVLRDGHWQLLDARPAWDGNPTHAGYVTSGWSAVADRPFDWLVVVNLGATRGQCRVDLAGRLPAGGAVTLVDRLHDGVEFRREVAALAAEGLYVDLDAGGCNVFAVS